MLFGRRFEPDLANFALSLFSYNGATVAQNGLVSYLVNGPLTEHD